MNYVSCKEYIQLIVVNNTDFVVFFQMSKHLNRHLTKGTKQLTNKVNQRCLAILIYEKCELKPQQGT